MLKNGSATAHRDVAGFNLIANHMVLQHFIEVDAETIRYEVEMCYVRIRRIILHQDKNSALLHPGSQLVSIPRLHIMRVADFWPDYQARR